MSQRNTESVGVLVVRFQEPELHEGHLHTVEEVLKRHKTVLFVLGVAYTSTDKDPLSFEMRKMMIQSEYPDCDFMFVASESLTSSSLRRSRLLDELIASVIPGRAAVVYGARDSIVHSYHGVHPKVELPTVTTVSSTQIRNSIEVVDSIDFRRGVIYNAINRKPMYYPSVDVAVVHRYDRQVLLIGWKEDEGKLRFPGSFFKAEQDESFEDTGARCVTKEIHGIVTSWPQLVASKKIVDPRFRKTKDGVVTTFMIATLLGGTPCPGAGIDLVRWVPFEKLGSVLTESHLPLGEMLCEYRFTK